MSPSPKLSRSLADYASSLLGHLTAILILRHRGQGLFLSDLQLLVLAVVTIVFAVTAAALSPGENAFSAGTVGAICTAMIAACYSFIGRVPAAGFIILTMATEALSVVFRLVDMAWVDRPISA